MDQKGRRGVYWKWRVVSSGSASAIHQHERVIKQLTVPHFLAGCSRSSTAQRIQESSCSNGRAGIPTLRYASLTLSHSVAGTSRRSHMMCACYLLASNSTLLPALTVTANTVFGSTRISKTVLLPPVLRTPTRYCLNRKAPSLRQRSLTVWCWKSGPRRGDGRSCHDLFEISYIIQAKTSTTARRRFLGSTIENIHNHDDGGARLCIWNRRP